MRILVYCSDVLPLEGLPTSGGGLRCWQLIRSLQQAGHTVIPSMPLFTYHGKRHAEKVPTDYQENAWRPDNQEALFRKHQPDAVLFTSTWIVDHLGPVDALRIYDLDGPQLLEMHYKQDLEPINSTRRKVECLSQADFVFCAGHRQRYYFWPFLLLAGFGVEELSQVPVIPVSWMDPLPEFGLPDRPEVIVAGGFYPWQDPRPGLQGLADVLARGSNDVRVRIIGSSHNVTGEDERQFEALKTQLSTFDCVEFLDFVPHADLTQICQHSSFAVELHACNPERELALTTRTIDAMACGLPVLYNAYGELSQHIADYQAGWTVDPSDPKRIQELLHELLHSPIDLATRKANAQKFIKEHHWGAGPAQPLLDFLESPKPRVHDRTMTASLCDSQQHDRWAEQMAEWNELKKSRAFRMANGLSQFANRFRRVNR